MDKILQQPKQEVYTEELQTIFDIANEESERCEKIATVFEEMMGTLASTSS